MTGMRPPLQDNEVLSHKSWRGRTGGLKCWGAAAALFLSGLINVGADRSPLGWWALAAILGGAGYLFWQRAGRWVLLMNPYGVYARNAIDDDYQLGVEWQHIVRADIVGGGRHLVLRNARRDLDEKFYDLDDIDVAAAKVNAILRRGLRSPGGA